MLLAQPRVAVMPCKDDSHVELHDNKRSQYQLAIERGDMYDGTHKEVSNSANSVMTAQKSTLLACAQFLNQLPYADKYLTPKRYLTHSLLLSIMQMP